MSSVREGIQYSFRQIKTDLLILGAIVRIVMLSGLVFFFWIFVVILKLSRILKAKLNPRQNKLNAAVSLLNINIIVYGWPMGGHINPIGILIGQINCYMIAWFRLLRFIHCTWISHRFICSWYSICSWTMFHWYRILNAIPKTICVCKR